ncbi:hypothetical protein VZ95_01395 [Elstera litoralis]|uniref:PqqD family protein n=1 Tax=Elstera litoralis TaxID=552518 RepID=A0A0F3IZE2_9PROT|nr:hypothetical protein VZ95_01395 [Elstera litoralis]
MPNSGQVPLDRSTHFWRVADVLATEVGGEMVIMNVEKGVYFGLDPIGTDIWKRLEESITVAALAGALVQVYDADIACIERDVLALLTRMVEQGLVEVG